MPPLGLPRDPGQWLALAAAAAMAAAGPRLLRAWPGRRGQRAFVALTALLAAALSAAYVAAYLRGGPRIIDATSYFLEARALSRGALSFPTGEPAHSVLGRFLVRSEAAGPAHAAVIFPPGYPALLALGFLARAPMAVGPLLAAALVAATAWLALQTRAGPAPSPLLPRLAALLSATCAALRYHTADTMAHGLSALCVACALALAFQASAPRTRRPLPLALAAGLALGWLAATRPPSAAALAPVLALALATLGTARPARRAALAAALAAGTLPGLALLALHQHAATGAWATSSQRLYYALADGPPGCFAYGFGPGIGCLGEHGDFVRARLPQGFGALAAAGTTLRRLGMHLLDVANLEPLALLVPLGAAIAWPNPRVKLLALAVLAQIAAYAPFYFDGNYPGGGARLYADILPLEHVLAALAVLALARRSLPRPLDAAPRPAPPPLHPAAQHLPAARWASALVALALAGFAFHAGFDHAALRDRDGGRPMFEPARLAEAAVTRGLVFIDTDHGFNLAFDPRARASTSPEILRLHGDALDRLAWEARGRPPAYRYTFDPSLDPPSRVTPLTFDLTAPLVLEGASLWPPRRQRGGYALPEHASGTCASASRWLALHPAPGADRTIIHLDLPTALAGRDISPRLATLGNPTGDLTLLADATVIRAWSITAPIPPQDPTSPPRCFLLPPAPIPAAARLVELVLTRACAPDPCDDRSRLALDDVAIHAGENR